MLECEIDVPRNWPGPNAGQFLFITADRAEGAHPFTVASAWGVSRHQLTVIAKELGDWTGQLHETLRVGQPVVVERPYGCVTIDDDRSRQIWVLALHHMDTSFVECTLRHLNRSRSG